MEIDPAALVRLERGDVLTSFTEESGHKRACAMAVIDAGVDAVWGAITDYENYAAFMPHTRESSILERKKNQVLLHTVLEFPIKQIWYDILLTLDKKNHRVDWVMHDGSIKSNEGSWHLARHPKSRTLATYTLATDPGFYVPKFLLEKATQGTLPLVIQAVRKRVASEEKDR